MNSNVRWTYNFYMPFEFRLRFHLLSEDRIVSAEQKLELPTPAAHLRLAAWKRGVPIENGPRVVLVGGPYDSAELAREDGQRARKAVYYGLCSAGWLLI
jgi:hypothetical protein